MDAQINVRYSFTIRKNDFRTSVMNENRVYTRTISSAQEMALMTKHASAALPHFGERLAQLRKGAGYTQLELATEIGVSRRMIAYYEAESQYPPAALLPELARALGVTVDALLGVESTKKSSRPSSTRLERRFQQIENLGPREKRQILQLLDTFLENQRLKKQASARHSPSRQRSSH